LHDDPVVRMDVKVAKGRDYIVVITHREYSNAQVTARVTDGEFEVYFMRNNYTDSDDISGNVSVSSNSDSLLADTSYAYFDFTCADVDAVMLDNQKTYTNARYTGGELNRMAEAMGTAQDRFAVGTAWRNQATALLSYHGRDTALLDLNELDLSRGSHAAAKKFMDSLLVDYGYMPMVIENCNPWEVKITDEYETFGDCGIDMAGYSAQAEGLNVSGIITRTFVVSDAGTKTDKDTAHIQLIFRNPNLYDVRLPHYTVNLECDEVAGGITSTAPSSTGYPFVATLTGFVDLTPSNAVCNLAASYEDVARVETCANTYKFRREWTVYDWCRPGTTIIYNQLIKVGDWTAPEFKTEGTIKAYQYPQNCNGYITFTAPVFTDNCGTVTYTAKLYAGSNDSDLDFSTYDKEVYFDADGSGTAANLAPGDYTIYWTATDDCGNTTNWGGDEVTIEDNIAPSCVIDDLRSITLTNYGGEDTPTEISTVANRGEAWVTAERLDEGSWDNCGTVETMLVSRMTATGMSTPAAAVSFTCADEGVEVLVELHVWDDSDNHSVCWTYIKPVDKTQPECTDIGTVNYYCNEVPQGEDLSGSSDAWDVFFDDSITLAKISDVQLCSSNLEVVDTESSIDQCGYGWVNRYYRVYREIDGKEFADTCRMSLVFSEDHLYSVTFPADVTAECTDLADSDIAFVEGGCDLITVSTSDERFDASADECYKVFRTFKVINWCEYEEGSAANTVARRDWNKDGIVGDATTVNVKYREGVRHIYTDWQNAYGSNGSDNDRRDTILSVGTTYGGTAFVKWESAAPKAYSAADVTAGTIANAVQYGSYYNEGYWTYTQVLKVYDDAEPTVVFAADQDSFPSYSNAAGCPGDVVITATLTDGCTTNDAYINVVEAHLDVNNDGTEQTASFDADVTAKVTESGAVATYTANHPSGTHRLRLVVRDGCGNVRVEDHVFTIYDAKGPAPVCIEGFAAELMPLEDGTAGMAVVNAVDFVINNPIADCSGAVSSFEITRVTSDIEAALAADDLAASLTLDCDDLGQIDVAVVATDAAGNSDYCVTTITVQDNVTPCSGAGAEIAGLITTEENSVVSGVEISLNADKSVVTAVDGGYFFSGLALGGDYSIAPRKDEGYLNGVSTYDLVLISKHILGVTPLASPYKLIAADVNNSNSITTLDLIQLRKLILSVDTRLANNTSWRFVPAEYSFPVASNPWAAAFPEVLNINDFDGSANGDFVAIKVGDVNNSALIDVQPRSNASFALNVEDMNVKAGNEYTVSFKATAADVEGFQVALSYRGLELVDIVEGVATADNFGTKFTGEGVLLTSWNGTAAEGELFSLVFRATQDVVLSEALSVSTRHLNAEAYNTAGEAMNVAINFNSGAVAEASFELKQNMPNPFKGETVIGFNLAEASNATLTINDVTGRVLKVVRGDFAKGANQVSIDSKELPAAGVLYYTLTAGEYTATKKMIIIE